MLLNVDHVLASVGATRCALLSETRLHRPVRTAASTTGSSTPVSVLEGSCNALITPFLR